MMSHLAEALATRGHKVFGVDDLSGGVRSNLPEHIPFQRADLSDADAAKAAVGYAEPDVLVHGAANAREGASWFQPLEVTRRNMTAYMNVLEPCVAQGTKKVVVYSSMAAYGEQPAPFREEMPLTPCDIYGLNKAMMEQATEMLAECHGFDFTVIRPHNVFGPKQAMFDPYRNVMGIWMNRILRGEPIHIYGDGEQTRAFSFIDDSLPCYVRCVESHTPHPVYNIGGNEHITLNVLSEAILEEFSEYPEPEIVRLPLRHGEVKHAWSAHDRAARDLGFVETVGWREGVHRMASWAKNQGPQEWHYDTLPLQSDKIPATWQPGRETCRSR